MRRGARKREAKKREEQSFVKFWWLTCLTGIRPSPNVSPTTTTPVGTTTQLPTTTTPTAITTTTPAPTCITDSSPPTPDFTCIAGIWVSNTSVLLPASSVAIINAWNISGDLSTQNGSVLDFGAARPTIYVTGELNCVRTPSAISSTLRQGQSHRSTAGNHHC